jgi:hypothetical protein
VYKAEKGIILVTNEINRLAAADVPQFI